MATGGVNYSPEGIDRHAQLTVLLNPACAIILRAIIKYLVKLASPGGHSVAPWTLQQFLAHKRQVLECRHSTFLTTYEKCLYPTDGSEPNHESWDVSLLCLFIQKVCQPNAIAALQIDVDQIQRIRNEMSHLSHTNINEDDYNTYKNMLYVIMDRMLKLLKDDDLDKCVQELKIKAAVEVPRNPDLAPIFSKLCEDNDETHKKLDAVHTGVLAILRKLDIPTEIETDVFIYLSKCSPDQQALVSNTIVRLIEEKVGRDSILNSNISSENMNSLKAIIEDIMKNLCSNGSTVLAARSKCIAMRMRCQTIGALCDLFEQSIDGRLTEMFRPIETFFRTLPGYEKLEIEVNVIQRDYIRCIQQAVQRIVESKRHIGAILQVVKGVTIEHCDDSEDRRIRINLHPKTRDHLQHIRDTCSSGQLDEQLAKMADILNSTYGTNMTIRSQLGDVSISETEMTLDTGNEHELLQAAVPLQSTKHVETDGRMQRADFTETKGESEEPDNTSQEVAGKEDENDDAIPLHHVKQETQKIPEVQSRVDANLVERKESADLQNPQNIQSMEHLCDHDITTDVCVAAPKHGTRTDITKGDLEQDITQTRVENWQERLARLGVDSNVGNAKCDEYATIVYSFLKDAEGLADQTVLSDMDTRSECGDLPACLRNREVCQKLKHPLFKLTSFAFNTLFCQDRSPVFVLKSQIADTQILSTTELRLWLKIGLVSQDMVDTQRTKDAQIKFSHKTIQEFLAALYMAMHTDPDNAVIPIAKDVCRSIDMVLKMSQVFVFLSGMAPVISNTISRYISQIVSADEDIQSYRRSCSLDVDSIGRDHVRAIQELMIDCVRESMDTGHTTIETYIQDIIIDEEVSNSCHIDEWIRFNKLDIVSITVDINQSYRLIETMSKPTCWKEINTLAGEHLNRLRKLQVVFDGIKEDAGTDIVVSMIRGSRHTLEFMSLCGLSFKRPTSESLFDFRSLSCVKEVDIGNVDFNVHQLEQLQTLRRVDLQDVTCSHCPGQCRLDLSQLAQLKGLHLLHYFGFNSVHINTSQLEECQIDYRTRHDQHIARSVIFHGEGQHLRRLSLTNIVLKHDQLVQLMLFVTNAAGLCEITLKRIKCCDCQTRCTCVLDLSRHTQLEKLKLEELDMSEVHTNMSQLEECLIHDRTVHTQHTYAALSATFNGEDNCLQRLSLTNIVLKHDQLVQLMLLVTKAAELREMTLKRIKCCDCQTRCTCVLDLSRHTQVETLKLEELDVSEVHVNTTQLIDCRINSLETASSTPNGPRTTHLTLVFHDKGKHLQYLKLTNVVTKHEQLEQLLANAAGLQHIYLNRIKCCDCFIRCTCKLDLSSHNQLEKLELDGVHVSEVQINTAQLIQCKIISLRPGSSTPSDPVSAQTSLVFHEGGRNLQHLTLKNVVMTHDRLDPVMLFLTHTTGLKFLTLDDITCSDCISGCICRLDLSRHTRLRRLGLTELHVSEINVNVTHMMMCDIDSLRSASGTPTKSGDVEIPLVTLSGEVQRRTMFTMRNIALRHEHLKMLMTHEIKVFLSGLHCVDCNDSCSIIGDNRRGAKGREIIGRPKRLAELTISDMVDSFDSYDDYIRRNKLHFEMVN